MRIDYEALALEELRAASTADSPEGRNRHLDMAAIHAFKGEKAAAEKQVAGIVSPLKPTMS